MTIRTYIAGLLFSIASLGLLFPRSSAQSAPVTGLHVQGDSVAATSFPGADLGAEINAAIAASSIPVITVPIGGAISTPVTIPTGRTVVLGAFSYTLNAPITLANTSGLKGAGRDFTLIHVGSSLSTAISTTAVNPLSIVLSGFSLYGHGLVTNGIVVGNSAHPTYNLYLTDVGSSDAVSSNIVLYNTVAVNVSGITSGAGPDGAGGAYTNRCLDLENPDTVDGPGNSTFRNLFLSECNVPLYQSQGSNNVFTDSYLYVQNNPNAKAIVQFHDSFGNTLRDNAFEGLVSTTTQAIATLSSSGTTVTGTYTWTGPWPIPNFHGYVGTLVISGTSGVFDGNCTSTSWTSPTTFTCTESGLSGTHTAISIGSASIPGQIADVLVEQDGSVFPQLSSDNLIVANNFIGIGQTHPAIQVGRTARVNHVYKTRGEDNRILARVGSDAGRVDINLVAASNTRLVANTENSAYGSEPLTDATVSLTGDASPYVTNYDGTSSGKMETNVGPLRTPASSSAVCKVGEFWDDANYHYVCVATNTIKRAALSAF